MSVCVWVSLLCGYLYVQENVKHILATNRESCVLSGGVTSMLVGSCWNSPLRQRWWWWESHQYSHVYCKPLPDPPPLFFFLSCVCVCFIWACFPSAELMLLCQHGFIRLCICRTQTLIAVTNLLASDVKENRRRFIWHGAHSSWMNQTSHKCPWNLSEVLRA